MIKFFLPDGWDDNNREPALGKNAIHHESSYPLIYIRQKGILAPASSKAAGVAAVNRLAPTNGLIFCWSAIESVDQLDSLWDEWDDLAKQSCQEAIFHSSIWLRTWIQTFWQPHWELFVHIGRDSNGQLLAIIPIYRQLAVLWPRRYRVFPLGQGEPENAEVASEYLDVIAAPDYRGEVIEYMKTRLLPRMHELQWNALLDGSVVSLACEGRGKKRLLKRYWIDRTRWSVSDLSYNDRKKISRLNNRLKKQHAAFEWLDHSHFNALWPVLRRFHQVRWDARGCSGAFVDQRFSDFHEKICRQHGVGAFSVLRVRDSIAAINYYIRWGDTLYFYQSGWDSVNFKALSPGFLLHLWSIEQAHHRWYDFMMSGDGESYKAAYGCETTAMVSIRLCNSTLIRLKDLMDRITSKTFGRFSQVFGDMKRRYGIARTY